MMDNLNGGRVIVALLFLLSSMTSNLSSSQDIEATSEDFREGYTATELGSTATTESNDGSSVVSEKPSVRDIHVVGLFPLSGTKGEEKSLGLGVLPAVQLALDHVRESKDVLNGYKLHTTFNDTMLQETPPWDERDMWAKYLVQGWKHRELTEVTEPTDPLYTTVPPHCVNNIFP